MLYAVLHGTLEDTQTTKEELVQQLGEEIASEWSDWFKSFSSCLILAINIIALILCLKREHGRSITSHYNNTNYQDCIIKACMIVEYEELTPTQLSIFITQIVWRASQGHMVG